MTSPSDTAARALLIKKILNKANAQGTTPQERDTLNEKAAALMIKWGIEDAMLTDADRLHEEKIIQRRIKNDAPKSYSYEMTSIAVAVAQAMNCRGFYQKTMDGRTDALIVGFEADVDRVEQMFASLAVQCTLELGPWYREWLTYEPYANGTDKFNAKRSFIRGYATAIASKLAAWKARVINETGPGTDLVLVSRTAKVNTYVTTQMNTGKTRARSYTLSGHAAGHAAGQRADLGGAKLGQNSRSIER